MLPESVLEELTRPTALQRHIVELAWPSLNTVERVQVLIGSQRADWLTALAMEDAHAIVRYWAAREYRGPARTAVRDGKFVYLSRAEVPLDETGSKIATDEAEVVRLLLDETPYADATQLSRLVRMRKGPSASFVSDFVKWLEDSQAKISDEELAECAEEFFSQPYIRRDLTTTERNEWDDLSDDYYYDKSLFGIWEFYGKARPKLAAMLLYYLPFRYRGRQLSSDAIASLPDEKLAELARTFRDQPIVNKVVKEILDYPEHRSESLVARLRELTEREPGYRPPRVTPPVSNIHDEVASLRDELRELREQIVKLLAEGKSRRWF